MIVGGNSINIIGAKPYVADVDASKVIEAIRATGVQPTHAMRNYAHTICSGLKGTGMWQNSVALYGMLGGTAASHKFNWKDLRDLDAAYRLVPMTGGTGTTSNTSNGISGFNGTAGNYGHFNTFISPSVNLTAGNNHISTYITVDDALLDVTAGCTNTSNIQYQFVLRRNFLRLVSLMTTSNTTNQKIYPSTSNQKGIHLGNINGSSLDYFFNGFKESSTSSITQGTGGISTSIAIAGRLDDTGGVPTRVGSSKTYGFFSIGGSLTDQQAITSSQVITQAQSILGRA